MIRMNPTLPTATLTACPMSRMRSAVVPDWNRPPKILSTGPGTTANSRSSGNVPATTQRVRALYRLSRRCRSPLAWRSATKGLNM